MTGIHSSSSVLSLRANVVYWAKQSPESCYQVRFALIKEQVNTREFPVIGNNYLLFVGFILLLTAVNLMYSRLMQSGINNTQINLMTKSS